MTSFNVTAFDGDEALWHNERRSAFPRTRGTTASCTEPPPEHGIHTVSLLLGFDEIRQPGSSAPIVQNDHPFQGNGRDGDRGLRREAFGYEGAQHVRAAFHHERCNS